MDRGPLYVLAYILALFVVAYLVILVAGAIFA